MLMRAWRLAAIVAAPLIGLGITGCGGDAAPDDQEPAAEEAEPPDTGEGSGRVSLGEPPLTADPGSAWAEVEEARLDYRSAGSLNYVCDVTPDHLQVNFQTNDGQDLLLQASLQGDRWVGQLTFAGAGEGTTQFSAVLPDDADPMVVGDGAVSFEGTVSKVVDYDLANATDVSASVAVNCAPAAGSGEEATAELGGSTYSFPASGAQSFDCTVSDESLDVRINRLAVDGLQLEISARVDGEKWIGAVVVSAPEGTFTSTLSPDGAGLTVEGPTVDYTGTFTGGPSGDATGSVSVTCPV
jgi:hypothetical protein